MAHGGSGMAAWIVNQGVAGARTARELIGAIGEIQDHMEDVTVPLLAMHGGADSVTPPEGSKALVTRAHSTDKTLKIYPGLYHDLLHEPEKDQVMADLVKWLSDHAPPLAATPADPPKAPATGDAVPTKP